MSSALQAPRAGGLHLSRPVQELRLGYRCSRRLIASRYGSARIFEDFPRLVDLYLAGVLRIDELITHRYTPDEANAAFRALAAGENARALITF